MFLRPSPDRPYLRTKDLLLISRTTNKRPPAHLTPLFGASRPSILSNWTPTAFGLDQLSGGTEGRNGQKKLHCSHTWPTAGSDPELNRAEVQSDHHISTTALSGGLPRLASALYHQSTRNIFAVLFFSCSLLLVRFFAVSSSSGLVAGKNAMENPTQVATHFQSSFLAAWRPAGVFEQGQQATNQQTPFTWPTVRRNYAYGRLPDERKS